MRSQPTHAPMSSCTADDFKLENRITGDAADDSRDLLPALSTQARNQVGATLLAEMGVVTVMGGPNAAARGIDAFVDACLNRTRRQFGETILPGSEKSRSWRGAPSTSPTGVTKLAKPLLPPSVKTPLQRLEKCL